MVVEDAYGGMGRRNVQCCTREEKTLSLSVGLRSSLEKDSPRNLGGRGTVPVVLKAGVGCGHGM